MKLADNLSRLGTETAFEVLARAAALEREGGNHQSWHWPTGFQNTGAYCGSGRQVLRDGHHGYTPANGLLSRKPLPPTCTNVTMLMLTPNASSWSRGKVTSSLRSSCSAKLSRIMYPDPIPIYKSHYRLLRREGSTDPSERGE